MREGFAKNHVAKPFRPCLSVLVRVRPSPALIEPVKEIISQDPKTSPAETG